MIDSSAFVDPIDEIRQLASEVHQSIRLISSSDIKRLNHLIDKKKNLSWLILTDVNLFDDHLTQIRVSIVSRIVFENSSLF